MLSPVEAGLIALGIYVVGGWLLGIATLVKWHFEWRRVMKMWKRHSLLRAEMHRQVVKTRLARAAVKEVQA